MTISYIIQQIDAYTFEADNNNNSHKKTNTISVGAVVAHVTVDHKLSLCKFCRRFQMYMNTIIHKEKKGRLQLRQKMMMKKKIMKKMESKMILNLYSFL